MERLAFEPEYTYVFFFFLGAQYVFGLLILSPEQYLLPSVFGLSI